MKALASLALLFCVVAGIGGIVVGLFFLTALLSPLLGLIFNF